MIANVATHASSVPPPSSSESKPAAAEPGFQTALSSSLESAKAGDNAASTAAQQTGAGKQPNETERGRSEKKRETADAAATGEPAADPSTVALPVALALSIPPPPPVLLPAPVTVSSSQPPPTTNDAQDGTVAPRVELVLPASAQTADPRVLSPVQQQTPGGQKAGLDAPAQPLAKNSENAVPGAQPIASAPHTEALKVAPPLPQSVSPTPGEDTHSRTPSQNGQAVAVPITPAPDIKVATSSPVQAPVHAAATAFTPVHAPHGANPAASATAGFATPQASVPGTVQDNSTGEGKSQSKDEGLPDGGKAGKSDGVSTTSGTTAFFSPAPSLAPPPVHASLASIENANSTISPLTAPTTLQPVGFRSESSGEGSGVAAPTGPGPGASAIAEPPPINTARVLQSMNGTEMRVGIHSQEFGSISIATSVSPGGVAAQIALDHGALSRALASHLPAIEDKLGSALGVSARVEVRGGGAQTSPGTDAQSSGGGASAGGGSQRGTQGGLSAGYAPQRSAEAAYANAVPEGAISKAGDGGRLSVQA